MLLNGPTESLDGDISISDPIHKQNVSALAYVDVETHPCRGPATAELNSALPGTLY